MSDKELEDAMRSEMSMYFFSDEDSLNEDVDPTTAEAEAQKLIDVLGVMVEPDPNNYGDQIRLRVYPDSKPDDRFYNSRSAQGFSIAVEDGKYLFSSAGGYRRSIEPIAQLFGVEPNYNTGVAGRSNIDMSLKKKPIDLATVKMIVNYMQKIINASKKVPFVDERTGEYNLKYNMMNLIEDYYMPVRGSDNGTSIDTLKGLEYNMIDDINYLKGKLMAALKIPKAYLGYEEDTNGKATLASMDIRFAKTIERVQRVLISELTKIAIVHLYAQGINDDRLTDFTLELTVPSRIYEQEQVELYTSKVALIQQMQQTKMFSKEWMYESVMKMAKDEQDELTLQVLDDTKQMFRLTSIETQGVDPAKETGTEGGPTNVEEELNKLKLELDGQVGRPKDPVRYGHDDHPEGRDPLGIKTLKAKEGSVPYKPRKSSYFEVFKDMDGNKKTILTEDLTKK